MARVVAHAVGRRVPRDDVVGEHDAARRRTLVERHWVLPEVLEHLEHAREAQLLHVALPSRVDRQPQVLQKLGVAPGERRH